VVPNTQGTLLEHAASLPTQVLNKPSESSPGYIFGVRVEALFTAIGTLQIEVEPFGLIEEAALEGPGVGLFDEGGDQGMGHDHVDGHDSVEQGQALHIVGGLAILRDADLPRHGIIDGDAYFPAAALGQRHNRLLLEIRAGTVQAGVGCGLPDGLVYTLAGLEGAEPGGGAAWQGAGAWLAGQ
jgi:hypothetical protein